MSHTNERAEPLHAPRRKMADRAAEAHRPWVRAPLAGSFDLEVREFTTCTVVSPFFRTSTRERSLRTYSPRVRNLVTEGIAWNRAPRRHKAVAISDRRFA